MKSKRLITLGVVVLLVQSAQAFESGRIEVSTIGEGEPVILVPGLNGSPGVWNDLLPSLDGYEVHLVHVKGFADLPAEDNATGEILVPVASELARYISDEDLNEVFLIGHSMGGMVATLVAAQQPDAVAGLMTVDIPAYFGEMMGMPPEQVIGMADGLRQQAMARGHEERVAAETAFVTAGILDASRREPFIAEMTASDATVSAQAQHDVMVADLRPVLAGITAPTTVVFVMPAAAPDMTDTDIESFYADQYQDIKELKLEFIDDAGHYAMIDQPEHFAALVKQFLSQSDKSGEVQ
ncbi:MAG: alpha/beta hydrolase [Candidatus Devosia phytovorans]|uniref:Alpha/beta hydrolase n=1 Tax=Candidatus Devosia phytovorans TaxID=3121372 RepID=A0AAJ5VS81_9HYPH|nr:alpha/beta hydrolase [Devosia sp.]WEK02970.1 MAG: alpha/beta hydrolase [Devosia sp.]